jgi:hypothetical protein
MGINCPTCGAAELYLIGAVVRGQSGIVYEGSFTLETLSVINPVVQDGLLLCRGCKRQWTTREVHEFNELLQSQILWEPNHEGIKVPIICPTCKNTKDFIKVVTLKYQAEQEVRINAGEIVSTIPELPSFNPEDGEVTVLRYECALDNCTGVILITPTL